MPDKRQGGADCHAGQRQHAIGWKRQVFPIAFVDNPTTETKKWAESHLNDLILVADEVLEREGMDYQADAHVTKCCFPEKKYGDMTFPQGEYEALRITLGEAAGHNWWCVLYPNLCFLDKTCAVVSDEGKEDLKGVLTDEEYQLLTDNKELKVKWFFFGD